MTEPLIPRIAQADMADALATYLGPRVARLGYLGEMFQVGANTPEVMLAFLHFTDALKDALPFDIGETTVLTVAALTGNRYETQQHERLCLRNGLSKAWVIEVEALAPEAATLLSPAQRAVQRFSIAMLKAQGRGCRDELAALREHLSAADSMSLAFLIGRYVTHGLIVNLLDLAPPVPSVHEDGFTG